MNPDQFHRQPVTYVLFSIRYGVLGRQTLRPIGKATWEAVDLANGQIISLLPSSPVVSKGSILHRQDAGAGKLTRLMNLHHTYADSAGDAFSCSNTGL